MLSGANSDQQLKSIVERYRLILEHAPDAIVILDVGSGRFVEANARACEMFEMAPERIREYGPQELSPEYQPDGRASIEAVADWIGRAHAGPVILEWEHRSLSGQTFPCEVRLMPLPSDDGDLLMRGSIIDISARKISEGRIREINVELERRVDERTRELQQAMAQLMRSEKLAALGGLVAGLAHELNTPIGNILGTASTLKQRVQAFILSQGFDHSVVSELSEFLAMSNEAADILARNAERAGDLVANFKQVAADQTSERWRVFNLRKVVEQAIATLRPIARALPHKIDIQIPEQIEMHGYPGPLEQIVLNLTTNALDHALQPGAVDETSGDPSLSDKRSGEIRITAREEGADVRLEFADDGAGIAPEFIERIFEPFFTTSLSKGGTGLGLYLVYQLVTGVLEGQIEVASSPGQGTRFEIVVPRRLKRNQEAVE
ncbi:MAG: PAS domain-containing sensor histidine kinase [bacterium]|nr:PAS domain-containing sensor histidine kinase [bacterium]